MRELTHRDPVHGDVRFDPLGAALLDTAPLQRLGRIYQLGYAHLVYRGGTHTRLSHSMGTAHLAGRLVDQLRRNYVAADIPEGAVSADAFLPGQSSRAPLDARWDVVRHVVSWAALLHDVGHVPLGHTLEDEFDALYEKHDDLSSPRLAHLWFEHRPGEASEIRHVFGRLDLLPSCFADVGIDGDRARRIVMLICLYRSHSANGARASFGDLVRALPASRFVDEVRGALDTAREDAHFFPYMADFVSNTIGADYLDYMRRDPLYVGLDVLRDDRVASRFYVGRQPPEGDLRLALALTDRRGKPRLDTCTGVVELVRQRFRFAEIIYYHKTKVAASAMLARVFALIGTPAEIGDGVQEIDLAQIDQRLDEIDREGLAAVRSRCSPSSLLDPEIGDESLLAWLQQRGWSQVAEAAARGDRIEAGRYLRGLSLLQSLVRRKLHKVCMSIDYATYARLCPAYATPTDVEVHIGGTLRRFRSSFDERAKLERAMTRAAGFPDETLLFYVPPRKSQAKGIDTGALDRDNVVTLGAHPAVREEVASLGEAYTALWRMLLFVHPRHQTDVSGLSRAAEALIATIWPDAGCKVSTEAVKQAAWFPYSRDKVIATSDHLHKPLG